MPSNDTQNLDPVKSDSPDDLRAFIRESLTKLPVRVQIEVLSAIQEAGHTMTNEYYLLSHGGLLVSLACIANEVKR